MAWIAYAEVPGVGEAELHSGAASREWRRRTTSRLSVLLRMNKHLKRKNDFICVYMYESPSMSRESEL